MERIPPEVADTLFVDLNPPQREAVQHGESPLLIVAGAGTGKTRTLAHRVAFLIASGVNPGRILLVTFTRRAAGEMLRRVDGILRRIGGAAGNAASNRPTDARRVWGGTFHAMATRLIRLHGKSIGLDPNFVIHDRSDSEDLINVIRTDLGLNDKQRRFPTKSTCIDIYSRCVNGQETLDSVLGRHFPRYVDEADDLKQLFGAYVDRKQEQSVMDYDDLLLFWRGLMSDKAAAEEIKARFDYVLVDEFQDTNLLQADILKLLAPDGRGLTVVGDDAQSIYSFRSATVRNILEFPEQFGGTTTVTLEQNYRSTKPILEATNGVIAHAKERHSKNLWSQRAGGDLPFLVSCEDEDEQTEFLIRQILEHRESGIQLRRQAVLFRASHHSLELELELSRRNIPFHKYGGLKFIETAHVKDLLSFLRLAENPRDLVGGLRVLLLLPGVGPKRARRLLHALAEDHFRFSSWKDFSPPAAASDVWPEFANLMMSLASRGQESVASQIHDVRRFYEPILEERLNHAAARMRDLEQLEHLSSRFRDRRTLLSELVLDPPSATQDLAGPGVIDDDYLILSTIHSAKGLEWDAVYVIHAADGNIPSDLATGREEEIEEEMRLFYVALTRAKTWLYVCVPHRMYFSGGWKSDAFSFAQRTRFITDSDLPNFNLRIGSNLEESDEKETDITPEDIRSAARELWS
jgi:DNA helicase-2/ATP-dependent DNA helicase PcrA